MLVPSVSLCYIEEKERRVLFMEQITVSGDSNRITGEYFEQIAIELRQLDCVPPDTSMELFGKHFETPVMMSPLSHLKPLESGVPGMTAMAMGAVLSGSVMWAGMGDEAELERIVATGARTIKIIKPYEDNDYVMERIRHACSCGCLAVGMDLDHSFNGRGEPDEVCGYRMKAKSLEELKAFVRASTRPFVVKGVLSRQDARKCLEAGVQGIVVSHHHGIMDYAVPPLRILPQIAEEIGLSPAPEVPEGVQARWIDQGQFFAVNTTRMKKEISLKGRARGVLSGLIFQDHAVLEPYDGEHFCDGGRWCGKTN